MLCGEESKELRLAMTRTRLSGMVDAESKAAVLDRVWMGSGGLNWQSRGTCMEQGSRAPLRCAMLVQAGQWAPLLLWRLGLSRALSGSQPHAARKAEKMHINSSTLPQPWSFQVASRLIPDLHNHLFTTTIPITAVAITRLGIYPQTVQQPQHTAGSRRMGFPKEKKIFASYGPI